MGAESSPKVLKWDYDELLLKNLQIQVFTTKIRCLWFSKDIRSFLQIGGLNKC